ncbi:fumarate reductase flavoprotein subunit [Colletotrichum musicola]|uniref:Fumarate reductase flavoprotein subunit n=1 Tax=Colletotrichum musicola TaxID=2175873 RepID=A0A8H6JMY4_9PEZI|nr:fumarate reductase flavoprotein subunit [Colletotrichum musicola]
MALPTTECDVLVVGSGNAGFSAAISAAETKVGDRKPTVLLIDKCPKDWVGGNSYFTAGAYRTTHGGLADVLPLVNNVSADQAAKIDLAPYTSDDFQKDMDNVCMGHSDKDLARVLISDSRSTIQWLKDNGIRFQLSFNRQAYEVDGKIKFWGGLCLKTENGGKGLIEDHIAAAKRNGVLMSWNTGLTRVQRQEKSSRYRFLATVLVDGQESSISAKSIIFAAGGFESNPKLRSQYLGPGWDMAMVRGTPYNMGDCLELAIRDLDALPVGNWSGCHSTCWDANADPSVGDRDASNEYTKSGYPLGLMLNVEGDRFVDEGVAMRNYTYAKFGRAILQQPDHVAFQVWDARTTHWLRSEEYRPERLKENSFTADTIEGLADLLSANGLRDRGRFIMTLNEYNEAVYAFQRENPSAKWDPSILDGVSTQSTAKQLSLAKSNWALPMDKGPFLAVKVTCGVTFTFGGLKVDAETATLVSSTTRQAIPGLFGVGEMIGGLFYYNYPGGSGLTSGAVFGRRAGRAAAEGSH